MPGSLPLRWNLTLLLETIVLEVILQNQYVWFNFQNN